MRFRKGAPEELPHAGDGSGTGELATMELPAASVEEELAAPVTVIAAVNLLPRAYAERAARARARFFAICTLLFAVVLAVLLWLMAWQNAVTAQENLDAATAERLTLQAEAARYADVPRVYLAVDAAKEQLGIAMGNEVRWSFFMNDVALLMPAGVGLESMQATSLAPGAEPTVPESRGGSADVAAIPTIGTWQVSGKALSYNHVAKWLDVLSRTQVLTNPTIGGLTQTEEEQTKVVPFSSTAGITTEAMSGRYSAAGEDR